MVLAPEVDARRVDLNPGLNRDMRHGHRSALLAILLAALWLAGVWAGGALAGEERVLHRGLTGVPASLDPQRAAGDWELTVAGELFEGLISEDAAGEPRPGVARSWEVGPDGRVYTFFLRDDARWSDGSPVTAEDFEFAFLRLLAPERRADWASLLMPIAGAADYHFGRVKDSGAVGVKALDDHILLIILSRPTPYFLTLLKHSVASPLPRAVVTRWGDDWAAPEHLVSNGPFRLARRDAAGVLELVPNSYHSARASLALDRVLFHPLPDLGEGMRRFEAGGLHLYPGFPFRDGERLRRERPAEVRIAPQLSLYYLTLNTTRPPFDNPDIRRALALVLDPRMMTETVNPGGGVPAFGFVPPGTRGHRPAVVDWRDWPMERRIAEARRLFLGAGFGPRRHLRLSYAFNRGEEHQAIGEAVAAQWSRALAVETTLVEREVDAHYAALRARDYDVGRATWTADYDDAQTFLALAESSYGVYNYAGYQNPDYDRLLGEAGAALDGEHRARMLQAAEALLLRDMPYVPLYVPVSQNLVAPMVDGFFDNPEDIHRSRWLSLR